MKIFKTKKFIGTDYHVCMEQVTNFVHDLNGIEVVNIESSFTGICEVRIFYYFEARR